MLYFNSSFLCYFVCVLCIKWLSLEKTVLSVMWGQHKILSGVIKWKYHIFFIKKTMEWGQLTPISFVCICAWLKVNSFVWHLFLNRLTIRDNLCRRRVLEASQNSCSALCGGMEDRDHLFFKCDYYGRLWLLISEWLGTAMVFQGDIISH
jgi:hypothetical protein